MAKVSHFYKSWWFKNLWFWLYPLFIVLFLWEYALNAQPGRLQTHFCMSPCGCFSKTELQMDRPPPERSSRRTSHGLCSYTSYDEVLLSGVAVLAEGERPIAVSGGEWSEHTFQRTYFQTHINSGKSLSSILGRINGGSGNNTML